MPGGVQDFSDLDVYWEARALARRVFELTERFPGTERPGLVDQFRRAARAIGAQIAEAWAKRRYPRHFASKLSDADAEQLETRHWIRVALDCGYLELREGRELLEQLDTIGRMLNVMMQKAEQFQTRI